MKMKSALDYQKKICYKLSRARTLHFAHKELQHKTIEQQAEFLEMEQCKLHESVDCYIQCLALEQPEQPEKKDGRRWWLDGKLDKIGLCCDL